MAQEVTEMLVDRLARIEEKLDGLREDRKRTDSQYETLERRVSRAERLVWVSLTIAGAASGANLSKLVEALAGVQ